VSVIRDRIRALGVEKGAHGTPEEIGEWLCESIAKWTPQQKAAARDSLDRWHAGTIWDREHPARPYEKEIKQ
jgi:hypothetical protein